MQLGKLDVSEARQRSSCKTVPNHVLKNQYVAAEKQNAELLVCEPPPWPENEIAAPTGIGSGDKNRELGRLPGREHSAPKPFCPDGNAGEIAAILADAVIEVMTARLTEFEFQCHRLGAMVRAGQIAVTDAADTLHFAAMATWLLADHGEDAVQEMMARGMKGGA